MVEIFKYELVDHRKKSFLSIYFKILITSVRCF